METLLITGGMGFIGSNFIRFILNSIDNFKIINVDNLTYAGNPENLKDITLNHSNMYKFYKTDISNFKVLDNITKKENIDYIINFAAESHVDRSINNSTIFCTTNILGTQTLLNITKKHKLQKFLQISTDEVYGALDFNESPFDEKTSLSPNNPYSATKASADLLVNAYYKTYGLPINITRCSNNYGPFQFPEKLVPLMIINAVNNKKLPIYGKGINIRDWIYVKDHCEAILSVLLNGKIGETYNIGGDSETSNIDLVKKLLNLLNKPESLITFVRDRPGHDLRYAMNHEKITNKLKWEPKINLEDGLKKTVQWYLENSQWLDNVISKDYLKYYEKNYRDR
ncbi:hypothetical protein LCGC14_1514610 [marine sediment metagenome]|uniref:NAD(P)-binding domain-containing protein n=1 Tax=marine sediment metagenome TaxID=412755 RepID=A0A0F9JL46_9ZZZZ